MSSPANRAERIIAGTGYCGGAVRVLPDFVAQAWVLARMSAFDGAKPPQALCELQCLWALA
jgi:hypothetical protein